MGHGWRALMTIGLGVVLLVAAWRGHVTGRLRAGRSGFIAKLLAAQHPDLADLLFRQSLQDGTTLYT